MGSEIIQTDQADEGQPLPSELKKRRGARRLENITVAAVEQFLDAYADCGLLQESASKAGLAPYTINRLKKSDEDFAAMMAQALEDYRESLVREAHRRAVKGWDEPVFSQKLGTRIGVVRKYDSRLLELMLKRHIPDFREKFEGEITVSGGVLIAPAAAATPEDWAARYGGAILSTYADAAAKQVESRPIDPTALPASDTALSKPPEQGTLPGGGV